MSIRTTGRFLLSAITVLSALLTLTAATPKRVATGEDAGIGRAIDAYAKPLLARGDLSGQLVIARRGRIVLERNFGMADLERQVPVSSETRFNVASVTKPMTGIIAIGLIAEKKVGVQDTIAKWIEGFPSGDSIRVTHLLRHRAGIAHEVIPDSEMTRPFTAAEVVERAKRLPLEFPVGARESYSSGGFEVLARILEQASGRTYPQLLAERVFQPAGMTHSAQLDSREIAPGRASSYVAGARGIENAPLRDYSALVGAGSVWSTARDLERLVQAIVAGKMVAGVRESYLRGSRLDFNGRTGGFKAWAMHDTTDGLTAVFCGNLSTGAPDALKRDVMKLARGENVAPPALPELRKEPLAEAELRLWEGVYQIERGPRLELRVKDGALYSNDWVMWPAADGSMFSPRDYGVVRAITGPGGRVSSLDWQQGSEHYPAPRVAAK